MRRTWSTAVIVAAALMTAGCATRPAERWDRGGTAPSAVPDAFATVDGAVPAPGECRSRLLDPRDGTELRLRRSRDGRGDYAVPAGRYGVGADQLLRVDCGTGRPLGVVFE